MDIPLLFMRYGDTVWCEEWFCMEVYCSVVYCSVVRGGVLCGADFCHYHNGKVLFGFVLRSWVLSCPVGCSRDWWCFVRKGTILTGIEGFGNVRSG